jgi:hypothetical protein
MNVDIFNNVTNLLKSTFAGTPVYPSFGNHDTDLTDQFKPRNTLSYDQAWSRWRSWINDDTQEATCRKGIYPPHGENFSLFYANQCDAGFYPSRKIQI